MFRRGKRGIRRAAEPKIHSKAGERHDQYLVGDRCSARHRSRNRARRAKKRQAGRRDGARSSHAEWSFPKAGDSLLVAELDVTRLEQSEAVTALAREQYGGVDV